MVFHILCSKLVNMGGEVLNSGFECLTQREKEVLALIIKGYNNVQIGQKLIISRHTAKTHVCSILKKLAATNKTQIAVMACKEKFLSEAV